MIEASNTVAEIQQLSHRYGKNEALADINLSIPGGCMVGLIGPDGVGKSTLLSLISGARKIQNGRLQVLGGDLSQAHFRDRNSPRIAYMPQGLGKNLYATLSVEENLRFFASLFSIERNQQHSKIKSLLQATGLYPFKHRPAGQLSGGMKQKLGLCCALIHDPDLLILDEPTTGVDPLSRQQFWQLIEQIRGRKADMSVLVATAYMEEAARFDWLIPMNAGQVLATGSPADILQQTHQQSLEGAFIQLLPPEQREDHQPLEIPSLEKDHHATAIYAKGLTKRFGDFTAVNNIDLQISQGEIFGFLGSNGCGKTTTMKMLTGLLPATEGEAQLFGQSIRAGGQDNRMRVGYMSQNFSLYEELTVRQNLSLHARLFHLKEDYARQRIANLLQQFSLQPYADTLAESLPLGIRQRLSLAVAVIHEPDLLILDEPTSGVDPIARDHFWQQLVNLSREHKVTIFISTHFMNEAERCDRIALMHSGEILVTDTPANIRAQGNYQSLEDAFIHQLQQHVDAPENTSLVEEVKAQPPARNPSFSLARAWGFSVREALELMRDPIRLTFALAGSTFLMIVLGYGISMDVEDLSFAVLDYDQTPISRDYINNIDGSRYFLQHAPLATGAEMDQRMRSGELSLAIEIPPGFGQDLKRGRNPEVAVFVDGAMPFRAETISGYVQGLHQYYLQDLSLTTLGYIPQNGAASLEPRYQFNQDFRSIYAMVPAVMPLLLVFIPALLTALAVVREKELGSIVNLYVSPASRAEFLLGKQLPYVAVSMISFTLMMLAAVYLFRVPLKGDLLMLVIAALVFIVTSTGIGLLISAFAKTQISALAGTTITTMLTTISFSGVVDPVSSLQGIARIIGENWPATYFITISRGAFTKGLSFSDLTPELWTLLTFVPVITLISIVLLKRQER